MLSNTNPCHCETVEESSPNCIGEHLKSHEETSTPSRNFDCSICLDTPRDPVVTVCGHLFCWPCLHQWIKVHSVLEECPVCKACVKGNIIPLYGRGKVGFADIDNNVPPRPSSASFEHRRFNTAHENHVHRGGHSTCAAAALGIFPALFGFRVIALPDYTSGGTAYNGLPAMTSEQRRLITKREFVLYWFLILMSCFASLCFLLF